MCGQSQTTLSLISRRRLESAVQGATATQGGSKPHGETNTRECLAIYPAQHIRGDDVVYLIEHIILQRGKPTRIKADNGLEFISIAPDRWAYDNQVVFYFSRPGKPTGNAFIESYNGSLRDECLNVHWFMSLEDAQEKLENWRQDYNCFRPHLSLRDLPPVVFAKSLLVQPHRTIF